MNEEMSCNAIEEHLKYFNLTQQEYSVMVKILGKEPNELEWNVFSALWSEHCSYKSSKHFIDKLTEAGKNSKECLVNCGENAGALDIGNGQALVMKVESHNHPSAIAPFQGSASGVGGILRDIFAMGARPFAILNSLRFGQIRQEDTRVLLKGVSEGIAFYGNCIGVPNVGGEIYFNECYNQKPLVNVMCVGITDSDSLMRCRAQGEGNSLIYVGASTGKDGVGGAAFSSKELDEDAEDDSGIQASDPFFGKLLMEACLEIAKKKYLLAMQDMGAAGLIGALTEMMSHGNLGANIRLEDIPCRISSLETLNPKEILLSESQERMVLLVNRGFEKEAMAIFSRWGLDASWIGSLNSSGLLNFSFEGNSVLNFSPKKVLESIVFKNQVCVKEFSSCDSGLSHVRVCQSLGSSRDWNEDAWFLFSSPNFMSKKKINLQYDHSIGLASVYGASLGRSDAAIMRVLNFNKGIALSMDGNSSYCKINPRIGAQIAVAEALRNIVCSGGKPLGITDGINIGNPDVLEGAWQLENTMIGLGQACSAFNVPVISGNVSLFNENEDGAIYPTPIVGAAGLVENLKYVTGSAFVSPGDIVVLLGSLESSLDGSEYWRLFKGEEETMGSCPRLDLQEEIRVQKTCFNLIRRELIVSAHDISDGGLLVALTESCEENGVGIRLDCNVFKPFYDDAFAMAGCLFGEDQSRIVVSVNPSLFQKCVSFLKQEEIAWTSLGVVTQEHEVVLNNVLRLHVHDIQVQRGSFPPKTEQMQRKNDE